MGLDGVDPFRGEDLFVAASRPPDIADHGALGAGRARAQRGCSTARDKCGACGIDERAKRARIRLTDTGDGGDLRIAPPTRDMSRRSRRRRRKRGGRVQGSCHASNGWKPTAFRVQTLETVRTQHFNGLSAGSEA